MIMPQALRRLLPPLVGLLVNIIQNTTIVQVIGASELLETAKRQVERLTRRRRPDRRDPLVRDLRRRDGDLLHHLVPAHTARRLPREAAGVGSPAWRSRRSPRSSTRRCRSATTLGIRTFGDADEVDATLAVGAGAVHGRGRPPRRRAHVARRRRGRACARFSTCPPAPRTATIESKTNFLGAVREGEVLARSRPLHVGKTTIVVETDVFDAPGAASRARRRPRRALGRLRPALSCRGAVAVAQLVEPRVVVPVVAGSSPVRHP